MQIPNEDAVVVRRSTESEAPVGREADIALGADARGRRDGVVAAAAAAATAGRKVAWCCAAAVVGRG